MTTPEPRPRSGAEIALFVGLALAAGIAATAAVYASLHLYAPKVAL